MPQIPIRGTAATYGTPTKSGSILFNPASYVDTGPKLLYWKRQQADGEQFQGMGGHDLAVPAGVVTQFIETEAGLDYRGFVDTDWSPQASELAEILRVIEETTGGVLQLEVSPFALFDDITIVGDEEDPVRIDVNQYRMRDLTVVISGEGVGTSIALDPEALSLVAADSMTLNDFLVTVPSAHFERPTITGPTPLTIEPDGRMYVHAALWDSCWGDSGRRGGDCIPPPRSRTNYDYFHTSPVQNERGEVMNVGRLIYGREHIALDKTMEEARRMAETFYQVGAFTLAAEDEWGLLLYGTVNPAADLDEIRQFSSVPLSGDWREINGHPEFMTAQAVAKPAFVVPGNRSDYSLVAAYFGEPDCLDLDDVDLRARMAAAALSLA